MLLEKFISKFKSLEDRYSLKEDTKYCIALSGGSDSISLLHLILQLFDKNNIFAVTIDHDLRENSSWEAREVSKLCKNLGVKHQIIKWKHDGKINSGIQEKARDARYNLISNYCRKNNIEYLLTGHQFDDNLEEIFISLSHGSSIHSYLIPEYIENFGVKIIRPLLDFEKDELINYLNENKINFFEDETNNSNKYLRNRVRKLVKNFKEISNISRVKTSIENISRVSNHLNISLTLEISKTVRIEEMGYGVVDINKYKSLTEEIRYSLLLYILKNIGKRDSEIRLSSIKNLDKNIYINKITTLNGCKIIYDNENVIFHREFGKEKPQIIIQDNSIIIDERYKIIKTGFTSEIKYLNDIELKELIEMNNDILNFEEILSNKIKKSILKCYPFILALENKNSLHHIYNLKMLRDQCDVQFLKFEFQ